MATIHAAALGKSAVICGGRPLSDEKLLKEIRRLKRSVASFGGAILLSAYQAEASRRKLKEV
jgi:hypothetical protein